MSRADELTRAITQLLRDMQGNVSQDPAFVRLANDLQDYVRDWQAWRKDHLSWWSMVGAGDDLDRWVANYHGFRKRFADVVGKPPAAPELGAAAPGLVDQLKTAANRAAAATLAVSLAVGLGFLYLGTKK